MLEYFFGLTILAIFVVWICLKILYALGSSVEQEPEVAPEEMFSEEATDEIFQEGDAVQISPQEMKRSTAIVGTYKDLQISQYVKIDGRTYVFESIAVEKSPGVYHAQEEGSYVVIDDHLLYREILI